MNSRKAAQRRAGNLFPADEFFHARRRPAREPRERRNVRLPDHAFPVREAEMRVRIADVEK